MSPDPSLQADRATHPAPATPAANASLFGRTFGTFFLVAATIWCVLMVREFREVSVVNTRNGQAANKMWAEQAKQQAMLWGDRWEQEPELLQRGLAEQEHLREQEWMEIGYEPPIIALQVWQGGRLLYRQGPPELDQRLTPDEQRFQSDANWLYVEARAAERDIVVRRWQEVPGDWHFSAQGLSYYARPLFYSLPVMLIVAWLLLRAGFAPLRRIGQQISQRSAKDLAQLPPSPFKELAPVVDAVNGLMARLQERLEREREFLLDAAHEMKTPLAVIQLNAESLQDAAPRPNEAERRREAVLRMNEGVRRATHTVHQLLALARSGADHEAIDLQRHDLVALVRDRIVLSSQLALQRSIEVELDAPEYCELLMNRESIGALVDNLVDNAVKYSPGGSLVRVSVSPKEGSVELSVLDQGPGIPAAFRQKVFERFFRLPDQSQSGSGLGLAIVERAAAQHGAQVRLSEGPDGRGLNVSVSFPRAV
ncbi:ATP-binding protein [Paucibacter sp. AS339]|uniref:sensor histidine kinase n=1 Tax=Paucibacter hankyongi TaxID=3133434 RepID=UPI00309968F7